MRFQRRVWTGAVGCGCAVVAGLVGCLTLPPAPDGGGVQVEIETILASANFPVALAFAPDGRGFYTEKLTGRVRIIGTDGQVVDTPAADLPVVNNSEHGLLGIAVHPQFEQNGWIYVYYSRSRTGQDSSAEGDLLDNRVVRLSLVGHQAVGDETLIVSLPADPGPLHNGGNLHFGPDGKLYVTLGDLTRAQDAQVADSLVGRILRFNDDGSVPTDNPFGPANPTFALGLRNSFDFTFDPVGGGLFATENSTSNHDEINLLPPGANGGWPLIEGSSGGSPPGISVGTYVDPLVDYTMGSVVPTGIAFVPTADYGAGLRHQLLVGQYRTGRIVSYMLNVDRNQLSGEALFVQLPLDGGAITDLAFSPDGKLYVLTRTSILRIVPSGL